jgi:hypothetical protein
MNHFLKSDTLTSELAQIDTLLRKMPSADILGRLGLTSRREEISKALENLHEGLNTLASTALYFGGKPVIGSAAIRSDFAVDVLYNFKDLVTKLWASSSQIELGARGPITNHGQVELHITELLHGSVGFMLEEIDLKGQPLFDTATKQAVSHASTLIEDVAAPDDVRFQETIENIHPRVFQSTLGFFSVLHRAEATVRIKEDAKDFLLDRVAVDRGFTRLETSNVDEDDSTFLGQLIGLIPYGRRFEFQPPNGDLIRGKVAPTMSESFLQRLHEEQGIGKNFLATIRKRTVRRFGQSAENFTLMELQDAPDSPRS